MLKKHFITGLITLLPITLTIAVVFFIINFITNPFLGFFEHSLLNVTGSYYGVVRFSLQILLIFSIFFFTVLLGLLTRWLLFKYLLSLSDYIIHRIPIIKTVYKTSQQVIRTLLGDQSHSFKQVVLVPFPTHMAYCVGFVSSPVSPICEQALQKQLISVFVPTTPNPTSGFLMMYDRREVIPIDMKMDDALKYIISCGVITAETAHSMASPTASPAPEMAPLNPPSDPFSLEKNENSPI